MQREKRTNVDEYSLYINAKKETQIKYTKNVEISGLHSYYLILYSNLHLDLT